MIKPTKIKVNSVKKQITLETAVKHIVQYAEGSTANFEDQDHYDRWARQTVAKLLNILAEELYAQNNKGKRKDAEAIRHYQQDGNFRLSWEGLR